MIVAITIFALIVALAVAVFHIISMRSIEPARISNFTIESPSQEGRQQKLTMLLHFFYKGTEESLQGRELGQVQLFYPLPLRYDHYDFKGARMAYFYTDGIEPVLVGIEQHYTRGMDFIVKLNRFQRLKAWYAFNVIRCQRMLKKIL